jgi:hypothetical protein
MSFKAVEFHCQGCEKTVDSLELRSAIPDWLPCECGGKAELCISAPKVKTCWAWVTKQSGPKTDYGPRMKRTEHLAHRGYSHE